MILIINFGSSKVPYIEECVDEFDEFKTIPFNNFELSDLETADGVILSGAPVLITEQDITVQLEKSSWVKDVKIPVLGICFGHQLIGIHYGAFVTRMREDRDWQEIEVIKDSELFEKLPPIFEMMEDHCETVSVPPKFHLVATSDACVNEAMQHETQAIYGVQFHPEVSGNFGRTLFENFYQITERVKKN